MSDNVKSEEVKTILKGIFDCEFCGKSLSSKSALNLHKKTAKYCLTLQGKEAEKKYTCEVCNKVFILKDKYIIHSKKCNSNPIHIELENFKKKYTELENINLKLEDKINSLEKDISSKVETITKHESKIESLEKTISEIAIKAATKSTTTNNNNYNLQVFSYDDLDECAENLTEEHVRNGKYDEVIVSAIINKVICTDKTRGTLRYTLEDGRKVMDPGAAFLITKAAEKIVDKNHQLASKICEELHEDLMNTDDSIQESIIENKGSQIKKTHTDILKTSKGYNTEFRKDIKKSICENPRITKDGPRPSKEKMEREILENEIDRIVREIGD